MEEGAGVLAVTQGLQVPEVLPGLPARGPPPSASMSVWIQGQVGEGRVGEPGVLLRHHLPPNRTSPLRASEFSVRRACAFTQPSFYSHARLSPHTLHTAPPGGAQHISQAGRGAEPAHSMPKDSQHQPRGVRSAHADGGTEGPGQRGLGLRVWSQYQKAMPVLGRQPPGLAEGTPSRLPTSPSPFHGPQSLLKSRERRVVLAVLRARGMDYALVPQSVHLGVSQPWVQILAWLEASHRQVTQPAWTRVPWPVE